MFMSMLGYDGLTTVSAISPLLSNGWWCSKVDVEGLMESSVESDPIPGLLLLILREVLLVAPFHLDCWTLLTSAPLCSSPSFRVKIRVNPHRSHDCNFVCVCVCVCWSVGWKSASPPHHPLTRSPGADFSVSDWSDCNQHPHTHTQNNIPWENKKRIKEEGKKRESNSTFFRQAKKIPQAG